MVEFIENELQEHDYEIERKFIIKVEDIPDDILFNLNGFISNEIIQQYLHENVSDEDYLSLLERFFSDDLDRMFIDGVPQIFKKKTARLRQKGSKCYLTIKYGKGLAKKEFEHEITKNDFQEIKYMFGKELKKIRYEIGFNGKVIELDIFRSDLNGFVMAEIEFTSSHEAMDFVVPDWFGEEVTQDDDFNNLNLLVNGIPLRVEGLSISNKNKLEGLLPGF